MRHSKLVEIRKKAQLYDKIGFISIMVGFALVLWMLFSIHNGTNNNILLFIAMGISLLLGIINIVVTSLCRKQNSFAEDYFVLRIMKILNEQGIETDKFEVIEESKWRYRIGFHNQTVDYDKLQAVIDEEVIQMNKIMKYSMYVKLI